MKPSNRKRSKRTDRPTLPELDQTKKSVLNSLASLQSRRSYQHAMDELIDWYCSEPRLALNRGVVLRYRMQLETQQLAPATINVRLAAVRRLVYEAADTGLLSSELVAGIRRVKGIPQLGGKLFRSIRKNGTVWGSGITQNVVWYVVKACAGRAEIKALAPHDLRRTCARLCHAAGGELEQIQFLLGHASVQTTERYIGCKQDLSRPVNDRLPFSWDSRRP